MIRVLRTAALAAFVCVVQGCSSNSTTSPVVGPFKSIVISAPTDTATYKTTIPFSAVVTDTSGNPVSAPAISWSSSDPSVAVIDTRGVLTPKLEGSTTILAKGGGATSNPIVVTVIPAFGWVDETPSISLLDLHGVYFVDRLHGWAVGDQGTILSTSNAGLTWQAEPSGSTGYTLNAVFFPTGTHGFVVGSAGRILESTDGGRTWTARAGIATGGSGLNDVTFVNDKTGFIVGNSGVVLKTADAGANWTRILPSVTDKDLLSVSATFQPGPDTTAWAVGAGGTSIDSEDGGASWEVVATPFVSDARGVTRTSQNQAFVVAIGNYTASTVPSPAGPEWVLAPTPANFTNFYGVSWPTSVQLIAVGENTGGSPNVLRSIDQGTTWITQSLPSSAVLSNHGLRDVWFTDHDHGWAVGKSGVIVHTATGGDPF